MKTLLIGLGRQGNRILEFLIERGFEELHLCDVNHDVLKNLKGRFQDKVHIEEKDVCNANEDDRVSYFSGFDFIIDSLPSSLSWRILNSASKTKTATISVSFLEEDFMQLDHQARESGCILIPDCGVAPGFLHLLAGYSVNKLGGADKVVIKVGAIPEKPLPPFYHSITWSVADLLEEYTRPAKIRSNGEIRHINPFDDIIGEEICGMKLETFVTDGARSFLTSFPDVKNVEERTLRHPGHLAFMRGLGRDEFLPEVFEKRFADLPKEDIVVMEAVVSKGSHSINHRYLLNYDHVNNVHALVNAVAITAVQALILIREGKIKKPGVFPLELLSNDEVYESLVLAHKEIGASITTNLMTGS